MTDVPQEILDAVLDQAATLAHVSLGELTIVRAEPRVWNDGSLGCPQPGEMYTQALIEGYWVVVEVAGNEYDFRVGSTGNFKLCPS